MVEKTYDNAWDFLAKYEAVLMQNEQLSQLLLDSAYQNLSKSPKDVVYFGAIEENEDAWLFYCLEKTNYLILYAPRQDKSVEAALLLADFLGNNHLILKGIDGRHDICQSFLNQYKKYIDCTEIKTLGTVIMEIRKVNEIKTADGSQRMAFVEEVKLVADWIIQFQLETIATELDYEEALNKAADFINDGKIYLYVTMDNTIVSMAVAARKLMHGITISYVFTPEEYRGKGYAAANLYYLSKTMLEQGYDFCTLFADKKNPVSNRAYEKIGYRIREDHDRFRIVIKE